MLPFSTDYFSSNQGATVKRRESNKSNVNSLRSSNHFERKITPPSLNTSNLANSLDNVSSGSDLSEAISPIPIEIKAKGKLAILKERPTEKSNSHHGSDSDFIGSVKNAWHGLMNGSKSQKKKAGSSGDGKSNNPPTLASKYGICERRCIGRGATAVVRIAHKQDLACERLYAVKAFRKQRKEETEREYVKKLTSEFCISSTLHHPNIVETIDLVRDENDNWCEVMEYCPGGDLYSVIRNGTMTRIEIDCCFKQLILGVAYLHSMGVAHRDIKPENLLIDIHGLVKITDFGVSDVFKMVWENKEHLSAGICGSEPYIAPEVFKKKTYNARLTDVWSCGIVYYAMSYHGVPFKAAIKDDSNYKAFLDARAKGKYEPFRRFSPGCRDLMNRILEPDYTKRITIDEILENEWFRSIEVCVDCETPTIHHNHFAANYVPPKGITSPLPPRATSPINSTSPVNPLSPNPNLFATLSPS